MSHRLYKHDLAILCQILGRTDTLGLYSRYFHQGTTWSPSTPWWLQVDHLRQNCPSDPNPNAWNDFYIGIANEAQAKIVWPSDIVGEICSWATDMGYTPGQLIAHMRFYPGVQADNLSTPSDIRITVSNIMWQVITHESWVPFVQALHKGGLITQCFPDWLLQRIAERHGRDSR